MAEKVVENIEPINIVDETKRRYLNYALSVITSRALPDVRDGLKPVQRRILFAMDRTGYNAAGRTRKCVGVTGEVTKSYHPHGQSSVYDALVRIAQDFVMRYPLVHGEGNFGSVDGDPPAAERYTECKLMPIAEQLMAEIDQDTVDFRPTFDAEKSEPVVLPARFPQLLANGSSGIAVGMATNIPPHNLGELIKACLRLIDDPETTTAKLVSLHEGPIKGPDFPLGGKMLIEQRTLREIYETGSGAIRVQGEWKKEIRKLKSREQELIVIHSIPHGVNKSSLLAAIGEIIDSRKLAMVEHMVDESSLDNGMRIVLELKPEANHDLVMAYLFKHTSLQENFSCNFTCLIPPGETSEVEELQPRRLGIKDMLQHFLNFRQITVRRRFEYRLRKLRERIHILEGFRIIFNDLDRALEMIKQSTGRADAASRLRAAFPLDEIQSIAIVDLNLYKIGQLEIKNIIQELREKKREAKEIEELLESPKKLWGIVRSELQEFGDKYGAEKRRTKIADVESAPEFDAEAYIVRENTNVVVSRDGWVKRVGRLASVASTRVREGDEVIAVVPGSTLSFIVFLTSEGVAYTTRLDSIPVSSGYGEPITKLFKLKDGAKLVAVFTGDPRFTPTGTYLTEKKPPYFTGEKEWQLLVATAKGRVLRLPLAPYLEESTKAGRRFARLATGDSVVFVDVPTSANETMLLASTDGHLIHFAISEVVVLTGVGKGVLGMRVGNNSKCLGGYCVSGTRDVMRIENSNNVEMRFTGEKYKATRRGGKGYEVIKRGSLRRISPPEIELADWSQIPDDTGAANNQTNDAKKAKK